MSDKITKIDADTYKVESTTSKRISLKDLKDELETAKALNADVDKIEKWKDAQPLEFQWCINVPPRMNEEEISKQIAELEKL